MKTSELTETLYELLIHENDYSAVLIDGQWGCGKTTAIRDAVDKLKESHNSRVNNIIYKSLFGVRDINELLMCFSKKVKTLKTIGKIGVPFLSLIPYVGNQLSKSLDNALSSIGDEKRPAAKKIFVFDDIERADKNFSYRALFGLFNELMLNNCRIICLSSLNDLEKYHEDEHEKFKKFSEKMFDKIIKIDESPLDIFRNLMGDVNLPNLQSYCDLLKDNLRIVKNAKRLFDFVLKKQEQYGYNLESKYSEAILFAACVCTIRVVYTPNYIEEDDKYKKAIGGNYYKFLPNQQKLYLKSNTMIKIDAENNSTVYQYDDLNKFRSLCYSLLEVETFNSYNKLQKEFPTTVVETKTENDLLIDSFFYLNDEGKEKYFNLLKKKLLSGEIEIGSWLIERIVEIKAYSDFDLEKDGFLSAVIERVVKSSLNGNTDAFDKINSYVTFNEGGEANELMNYLQEECSKRIKDNQINELEKELNVFYKNQNYFELNNKLYDYSNGKYFNMQHEIIVVFIKYKFYLPDLSKDIDREKWSYCHSIARFAKGAQSEDAFIECLQKLCDKYPHEKSVLDKAVALIKYNISNEKASLFEENNARK